MIINIARLKDNLAQDIEANRKNNRQKTIKVSSGSVELFTLSDEIEQQMIRRFALMSYRHISRETADVYAFSVSTRLTTMFPLHEISSSHYWPTSIHSI
ncbi:hypothetical protein [Erwinia psidii]|uniref:Uncharacterized protein n=1 Tax=Erwinia psidii TaxID=69224 RepID=A0A3N6SIY1_9GAMM|nr:hypothetical protein [Erwinia psidii]MCX8963756.1 hypothetical protein [Erwinia psidii]RQM38731.1 hypothetical protein EB241_08590 [Erwinia psidii]